ncbi:MAG: hypothetical protein RSA29_07385 [Clostridium sp.]|uniref:hypothetical protein n=1 Tax=Clostridium sp. TaxID=1506 RepID=UPI003072ACF5
MNIEKIENTLIEVTDILNSKIDTRKFQVIDRGLPHSCKSLLKGKMGIYIFKYKDTYLKIGKVGAKSNARFTSQHYNPNSSNSNLAKSILSDDEMIKLGLDESNIEKWIKNNTSRIDILLDEDLGIFTLNLFEACLHYKFRPKYEGFKNQNQ